MYRLNIRSRHPSHRGLRRANLRVPKRTVVRFGSTTTLEDIYRNRNVNLDNVVELNTVEAVEASRDKIIMKERFDLNNVITAKWRTAEEDDIIEEIGFPMVAKHRYGSRGTGNYLISNEEEFENFMHRKQNTLDNYLFEKYHSYTREYRLHVTELGCFYTCRKMLKRDTEQENRWFRNDTNSVWILEDNELFDKPVNWEDIVKESINALKAVGLDFGACDVKVQSATKRNGEHRNNPKFFIIETNSAPSFGEITLEKYKEILLTLANE